MKIAITLTIILLGAILLLSCKKKEKLVETAEKVNAISEEPVADAKKREMSEPIVKRGYGDETDPFMIKSIGLEGKTLSIEVSYSGGCQEHDFELFTDGMVMKSLPPKQFYFLKHTSNGDFCKKMVTETLLFDMSSTSAPGTSELVLVFSGSKESVTLKFD